MTDKIINSTAAESYLGRWRISMKKRTRLDDDIISEMEDHIVDTAEDLKTRGLRDDEAYLIAIKRIGRESEIGSELSRIHSERLYKEMFLASTSSASKTELRSVLILVFTALCAALAPHISGIYTGDYSFFTEGGRAAYFSYLYFIPFITILLGSMSRPSARHIIQFIAVSACGFAALTMFPFSAPRHSEIIMAVHLLLLSWFALSFFLPGSFENPADRAVHFLKFTGETFIYTMLICLGGAVLTFLANSLFSSIGLDIQDFSRNFLAPSGLFAAPVVAAWLTEKSVI